MFIVVYEILKSITDWFYYTKKNKKYKLKI